jgi:hypothetical protein
VSMPISLAPPVFERFGKSNAEVLSVNQSFFTQNAAYMHTHALETDAYLRQPRRTMCKLCATPLPQEPDFIKSGIGYSSCTKCTHLNGHHEDTLAFHTTIRSFATYADYYSEADVEKCMQRISAIYAPKVAFLDSALSQHGARLQDFRVCDFGCGSGYFLAALGQAGVTAMGIEVDATQVAFGATMLPQISQSADFIMPTLDVCTPAQAIAQLSTLDCEIVSMIGVLEHLHDMRGALDAIKANPAIQYVYICVPLFGLCVFLEMTFPDIYPRHLASDHTHLFTDASLKEMETTWGFQRLAAWWFGSDMLDLYRFVGHSLQANNHSQAVIGQWQNRMKTVIDAMQLAIDHQQQASEVHLLLRKSDIGL